MFPLSDSIKSNTFPFFNYAIIIATIYIFFVQMSAVDLQAFINTYALIPANSNFSDTATLIPFITAIFLHGGWLHIISNMWFLFVFGDNVHDKLGPIRYLLLYFIAGIGGNIAQYFINPGSTIPMIGASGAVAGILGAYFVLFSYSRIKTLIFVLFFVTIIEIRAPLILGYWFVLQLFSGFGSIATITSEQGGVAFFAHIGGFIIGMIGAKMLKPNIQHYE